MKKLAIISTILCALSACAISPATPRLVTLTSKFDAATTKEQMAEGNGTIRGTAFMKQMGGGVVTCAGEIVSLIAVNDYASERLQAIYEHVPSVDETVVYGARLALSSPPIQFQPDLQEYRDSHRHAKCDSRGEFEFDKVKDGDYFLLTGVRWQTQTIQGGTLLTRVSVKNNQVLRVVMSS